MTIFVFGNETYEPDALPIKVLLQLREALPEHEFVVKDPTEDFDISPNKQMIVIDTIVGIDHVQAITSLDDFEESPRTTVHDFDLALKLRWLEKLGKLPPILIIGIPPDISVDEAVQNTSDILTQNTP